MASGAHDGQAWAREGATPDPASGASGPLGPREHALYAPKDGRMGKQPGSERPPPGRPKRDRKAPFKFSPDTQTGTARDQETGENQYPGWRSKSRAPDNGGAPGSPPQRPMQDQSNAGEANPHSGTSGPSATLLLLHLCGRNVLDEVGPGDAGDYVLDTQAERPDGGI